MFSLISVFDGTAEIDPTSAGSAAHFSSPADLFSVVGFPSAGPASDGPAMIGSAELFSFV